MSFSLYWSWQKVIEAPELSTPCSISSIALHWRGKKASSVIQPFHHFLCYIFHLVSKHSTIHSQRKSTPRGTLTKFGWASTAQQWWQATHNSSSDVCFVSAGQELKDPIEFNLLKDTEPRKHMLCLPLNPRMILLPSSGVEENCTIYCILSCLASFTHCRFCLFF